jgi:hypothetical protein
METLPSSPQHTGTDCPKCQTPLIDPRGIGWCQSCGYCHSLAEDKAKLPLEKPADPQALVPPGSGPTDPRSYLLAVSLVAGIVVLALASYAVHRYLHLTPLKRALWTTIQIALGVVVMFIGQWYALFKIAPEDATLHFTDAVVPFRLYGLVCKRLPRLALAIFLGVWGLSLVLCAVIFIGGLGHWFTYLPKTPTNIQ